MNINDNEKDIRMNDENDNLNKAEKNISESEITEENKKDKESVALSEYDGLEKAEYEEKETEERLNAEENQIENSDENLKEDKETKPEDADEPQAPEHEENKTSFVHIIYEILETVVISVAIVFLLITFVARYSPVTGTSMTYTINEGDSLLVQIAFYEPKKNDIVIVQAPDYDLNKPLIKRVIATEGDSLEIDFETWEVRVNGTLLDETYVRHDPFASPSNDKITRPMDNQDIFNIPGAQFDHKKNVFKATVPEGHIFIMGDNRNNSHDSRSSNVGFVDERCVVGRAVFRLAPFSDFGPLK